MAHAAVSVPRATVGPSERSVVHKHVQVREYVRELLAGAPPGHPAPSERELVHQFGVARMTVRQALDALVGEGLLERIPGRGTFVAQRRAAEVARLTSFTEDMQRRGHTAGSRTVVARLEAAGPGVARALEIAEGDPIIHWQRVRTADGTPMCIEDAYLPAALVPGMLENLPESLYAELRERGLEPTWGEDSVDAGVCAATEARLLDVPVGAPALRVARRAFADRTPVSVSRSTYRADKFTLWVPMVRQPHD
ncbi:GntR family transcriptional regulator [Nocardioides marmoribigeumensis]|jgi:GntR family transcriptional regulator|uniref:GntR family transcriptional regulator n=1 Tax=Nocardioides marmoribigeumensis TaxID=433649 RepID=A0ABU2BV26_9ACTN|nr:GntR family transcriptional regulator [Nocardioides marmoribigeumensis]MDR7361603.1 GntR family transcriptional regulator [Nocardioides marmoribigeumensis]